MLNTIIVRTIATYVAKADVHLYIRGDVNSRYCSNTRHERSGGTFASVSRASNSARKIGSLAGRKTWILKGPNSTTIGLMRRSRSTVQPSHEPDWRAEFWPICPGNVKI